MDNAVYQDCDNATASGEVNMPQAEVWAHGGKENNVHIACHQETKNPNLKFTIKGYTTLRKDRKDRSRGGLVFLIKSTVIKSREVSFPPNFQANSECSTEAYAIRVTLSQKEVTIVNTYHPDNTNIDVDLLNSLVDKNSGT
ncbi:hypothetical protein NPIL_132361 [Nephila pilipes]|uniref:Uncharacterized protein n=1 Tax=Nephila pilipes TaxID=299642 RepID=A0A8X6TUZ5_NEPPI|nr:hypothetical protein NPIL_132361 [Nephila pilipes]